MINKPFAGRYRCCRYEGMHIKGRTLTGILINAFLPDRFVCSRALCRRNVDDIISPSSPRSNYQEGITERNRNSYEDRIIC